MKKEYNAVSISLNQRAENLQKKRSPKIASIQSETQAQKLIHELEVNQTEIEMKNKELILSKEKVNVVADRYVKLYDLSPTSYFTLSRNGEIIELNLMGSKILGKERTSLRNNQFRNFVSKDTLHVFNLFLKKIFQTKTQESCEVSLLINCNSPIYVLITGIVIENMEQCFLTIFDITERKLITEAQEFLLHCGYTGSGDDFFESLSQYLAQSLDMEYVCIDRLEGDKLTAKTVAIYNDGKFESNVAYALKETPCGDVVGKTICCFPEDVCKLFPYDASLQELRAVSYIGTTLWSFDGKPIGLIAVIGRKPLRNQNLAEAVLKLVSVRAAGELERMHAVEVLRESEEKYRLLLDGMMAGFALHEIILDDKGEPCDYRFLSVNPAFERKTGLKAENIIGKRVSEALPGTERFWIDTYGKVALTGESIDFEKYFPKLFKYFRVSAFSHRKGYFATVFDDITKLVEAEKELQSTKNYLEKLINYANAPIIVWNPDTEIQLFNHAFEHLTGYLSAEVVGKKLDLLFPKASLKSSNAKIKHALSQNWETIEIPILTKNNKIRIVLWNSANIFDSDNRTVLSTIAQGNDVTERIKAEQKVRDRTRELEFVNLKLHQELSERNLAEGALKKSELQLKELNDTKDKFFNIVAHDLKNPFTSLLGSSELLFSNIDKMNRESIRKLAMILNDSAKGGYVILQNLLDWSRSQTGLLEFIPERVNLNDLIKENISNLKLPAANKEISLNYDSDENIYLFADRNMVNTVLRNLLSNAVKYTPRFGKIVVCANIASHEVIISVKDTGIGISKEKIEKLFRIDTKHSMPGTNNEQGTGLGLKLSKEFVEKQGGKIWVESIENQGSDFIFSIPLNGTE
jgi:PAS domain S-box-containing protein